MRDDDHQLRVEISIAPTHGDVAKAYLTWYFVHNFCSVCSVQGPMA
jgi:hypothetical protein